MMTDQAQTTLDRAILRTLAWFDVFNYPLTVVETWRWLYRPAQETPAPTEDEVKRGLDQLVSVQRINVQAGFYFLPGRSENVSIRAERKVRNEKKWARVRTVARFLEIVPFVRTVAVVNTLAIDNARPESDIDLLIVTAPDRIWSARMMVTGIIQMLGYRRHGHAVADKICLSFYLTTRALDLQPLKLTPEDPYLDFWATQVVPVMDDNGYEKFRTANQWVNDKIPNGWRDDWRATLIKPQNVWRRIKHAYESFLALPLGMSLESLLRNYQMSRMEKDIESKSRLGTTEVVISEDVLKFHEDDRRAKYRTAWQERCAKLGI